MRQLSEIMAHIEKHGSVRSSDVTRIFGVSREYARVLLQMLRDEGRIVLVGRTRQARYIAANDPAALSAARASLDRLTLTLRTTGLREDEVFTRVDRETGILDGVSKNVRSIVQYGFTEMLNNAIDHSRSETVDVDVRRTGTAITFAVRDHGIGIFNNVRDTFRLPNTMAAIQEILKGKTTTAPKEHTGLGVFFTSKAMDVFIADSFDKRLTINNQVADMFISDHRPLVGTRVTCSIGLGSARELKSVFDAHTRPAEDDYGVSKTRIAVRLYQLGKTFISRTEAKRVTLNLENFQEVELDFSGVESVGQGFADEVFRVWQARHPDTRLIATHANENVAFMVRLAGGFIGQDTLGI